MYFVSVYTHTSMSNNISACVLYMYLYSLLFSCSVMSNSLWPHCLQHTRFPCPSPSPGACSNSCPLVGDAIQPSQPLSSSPPALNLSQHHGLFQCVCSSHQVAKYWSFSFSISPSNEYSGLISFRIDWFDLLAVQRTFRSLLQQHNSKASIPQCLAFFHGPTLISVHDCWKSHSFDYMELC